MNRDIEPNSGYSIQSRGHQQMLGDGRLIVLEAAFEAS